MRIRFFVLSIVSAVVMTGVHPQGAAAQITEGPDMKAATEAYEKSDFAGAEQHFREAWRKLEARNAPASRRSSTLGSLAQVLREMGRLKESEELFTDALSLVEADAVNPAIRAVLLMNLSGLYIQTYRYARADSTLREAFVLIKEQFGPESPEMATALRNLGILHARTQKVKDAEKDLEQARAIAEKIDSRPRELASILISLSGVYSMQKKWSKVEPLLSRSIDLLERSFGPGHPAIADALINLGELNLQRGSLTLAEDAYRRALDIRQKAVGPDNIRVAHVLRRLGVILTAQRRYEEAKALFLSAMPIQERALGPNAPEFAATLLDFARLLRKMEDVPMAKAMEVRAGSIGERNSYTISSDELRR